MPTSPIFVFCIDDDEDDLDMLTASLSERGLATRSFSNGTKAMLHLRLMHNARALPDLIILDYNMPGADGKEILSLLKASMDLKHIPVVMYSTTITTILRKALMGLGAQDCLSKPNSLVIHNDQMDKLSNLAFALRKIGQTA